MSKENSLRGSKETQLSFVKPIIQNIPGSKFADGNGDDKKHYWLTPPALMADLNNEFNFDFDPCPYPLPEDFDGLTCDWGKSNYVNPPFGSIIHNGRKKGATAWARKSIEEYQRGNRVVMVYPIDKWILMLIEAGAKIRNLGDVKWCATEDGTPGKGTGRHIACFILDPEGNFRRRNLPAEREEKKMEKYIEDYNEDAKIIMSDIDNPIAIEHWLFNQDCFTAEDGVLPDGAIAGYLTDNGATPQQIDLVLKIAHKEDPD